MTRFTFALISTLLLLGACSSADQSTSGSSAAASTDEIIKLKVAHGWPKNYPLFGESVDDFKELVESMSNGRIQLSVDSTNKHKSAFGIFDFVKSGQYDIGQSASYYYGGKDPDALFFSSMPFSMTTQEQWAWFYEGGGLELANEVYAKHNIEVMLAGNTGMQMGGWFRKKVIAGVGGAPTNIPTGELYQALELGTIDALEWVGPGLDLRMGFHKVAPYYYNGWHEPGTELMYFFNKDSMAKLPEWAKSILLNAAKLTSYNMTTSTFAANSDNWQTISAQYPNVQIKQFPPAVMQALKQSTAELLDQEKLRSPIAKKIIESRANYLAKARAWTKIGDQLYLNALND